jgi:glycosyltransferase involved in cell wall biosynthesis
MVTPTLGQPRSLGLLVKMFPKLSETFVLEEILGLERLGIPIRLYTLAASTDVLVHSSVSQVQASVTRVPKSPSGNGFLFLSRHLYLLSTRPWHYVRTLFSALQRGRSGLSAFFQAGWLAEQLRHDGVTHLHTHFISTPSDVAELVSQMTCLPFSVSAHAKDIYLSAPSDLNRKLRAARFTVTCTEFNRRTLQAISPQAKVHRMYHGIDHKAFHPRHRKLDGSVPRILCIGRLREKKGQDTLIEACALLRQRGVNFLCEIVGYGDQQTRLQTMIASNRLDGQVTITGKLGREDIINRYARTSVYVQPSRIASDGDRDGIPNVLLEAMAMGLPVIATRVSGIPELIQHDHNGWLIDPDNACALADAIEKMILSPERAADLGIAARAAVIDRFDNDRNLRLVVQLLEREHVGSGQSVTA